MRERPFTTRSSARVGLRIFSIFSSLAFFRYRSSASQSISHQTALSISADVTKTIMVQRLGPAVDRCGATAFSSANRVASNPLACTISGRTVSFENATGSFIAVRISDILTSVRVPLVYSEKRKRGGRLASKNLTSVAPIRNKLATGCSFAASPLPVSWQQSTFPLRQTLRFSAVPTAAISCSAFPSVCTTSSSKSQRWFGEHS